MAIASNARQRGRSFEEGIALALQAILVSPDFLFRIEQDRDAAGAGEAHPVSEHELASRLSYFLWSSMPDDELLALADKGSLHQSGVMESQVRRMLRDPKAQALVKNFVGQWLEVRRLESVQPDRDRFPDFDDYLRACMERETEMFFGNMVRNDESVLDLINGGYSFLNERLARHYGVAGVKGPEFRKVDWTTPQRGGILAHASVLTVSSYANRTSPVLRGKWVLENLLNTAPPPPPNNVPSLVEEEVGKTVSLRDQLEKHRAEAVCASCHARMDPIGFSLENYDAIGAWRTEDGKFPIDASGSLPDGRSIEGPEDLKKILLEDRESFTRSLTEKLFIYALGRAVEPRDRATIRRISRSVAENEYRVSSLVSGIVNSMPFQMRKGGSGQS